MKYLSYKNYVLFVLIVLIVSCKEKAMDSTYANTTDKNQQKKTKKSPVLKLNKKKFTETESLHFNHSVGGDPIEEETWVAMKYDNDFLEIKFECRNNHRLDQNHYVKDNSAMFNQEVFELFICKGKEVQGKYLEIQINPNNALFLAKITNRFKPKREYKIEYIDTKTSGVTHTVEKDTINDIWKGSLKIPLKVLEYPKPTKEAIYRLNMFRVISNVDHADKKWSHTTETSTFACWNSTMTPTPQFHIPDAFGVLILE